MKYSVLTYLMGSYDCLHELPKDLSKDVNVEYICITDIKDLKSDTWRIVYDEELDNKKNNGIDKTFLVRYNPFKYCSNDICVRMDASFCIKEPLDDLINQFIDGNYDMALNIHPSNTTIDKELDDWNLYRSTNQKELQLNYIHNIIGYDTSRQGLIQIGFNVLRKNEITNRVNKDMLNILSECTPDEGHLNRIDQTLFSAVIQEKYKDIKLMFISSNFFSNGKVSHYYHNSYNETMPRHKLKNYLFFDKEVKVFE